MAKLLFLNIYPSYRPIVSSPLRDGEFPFLYNRLFHNKLWHPINKNMLLVVKDHMKLKGNQIFSMVNYDLARTAPLKYLVP